MWEHGMKSVPGGSGLFKICGSETDKKNFGVQTKFICLFSSEKSSFRWENCLTTVSWFKSVIARSVFFASLVFGKMSWAYPHFIFLLFKGIVSEILEGGKWFWLID